MAEKADVINSFVDMVEGPEPESEEITEELVEEVLEEELPEPEGPKPEGDDKVELQEVVVGESVYEVPPELAEHISLANDYTVKTQELSAERKTLETQTVQNKMLADQFEFYQSVQTEVGEVAQINANIEQYRQYKRQNIDSLTPQEFMKVDMAIADLESEAKKVQDVLTQKNSEFQQAQEQSQRELLDKSTEALRSRVPDWNDQVWENTKVFGQTLGFTEQELDSAVDPRAREVLWMASQYKAIKDKATPAVEKVKAAPKIQPKARRGMSEETQNKLNLKKQINSEKLTARQKRQLVEKDIGERWR